MQNWLVIFESVRVIKAKDTQENCLGLKETTETCQPDPSATKEIWIIDRYWMGSEDGSNISVLMSL